MTGERLFYWCSHFRRYVTDCTCHDIGPVRWTEWLVVQLAAIKLIRGAR